jgi:nucleotide-binding universal stress UspA family protein
MYRLILVPLDGSPAAERVLPCAQILAAATGARLLLLRAAGARPSRLPEAVEAHAKTLLDAGAYLRQIAAGVPGTSPIETAVFTAPPADAIVAEAQLRHADIVILATHLRSGLGRWLFGAVADQVLQRAAAPVLAISDTCEPRWARERTTRVLAALDGSERAAEALPAAVGLSQALGAELRLLRVVEPPEPAVYASTLRRILFDTKTALEDAQRYLQEVASSVAGAVRKVTISATVGSAPTTIVRIASELGVSAIAMATHGRGASTQPVLGTVATGVLHRAHVPVLLVRPANLTRDEEVATAAGSAEPVPV